MATTAALAIATALTLTTLTPVTAAAAAPTEAPPIVLNERCITGFGGDYPVESGYTLPQDSHQVWVGLPKAVSENVYTLLRGFTEISFDIGGETLPAEVINVDGVSVLTEVPSEMGSLASPGSVVTLNIYTWMDSHPCSNASDTSFIYEMNLSIALTVVTDANVGTSFFSLEGAAGASVGYQFLDWATPIPTVHWGDRVRIQAQPGYFPPGARLTATIWPQPIWAARSEVTAIASSDGSYAAIDLPVVAPDTGLETRDWAPAGLAIYELTPLVGSVIPILDLNITEVLRVSGSIPTLKSVPRALRTVTASPGPWGPAPVKLTYQWLLDGKPIVGATKSTYSVKLKDVNRLLSVRVTGTKAGYQTTTLTSASQRVRLL